MLIITCPFCGPRDETEFLNGGPAKAARPSTNVADTQWVDWLTVPTNPIGYVEEEWWHAKGCGKWFTIKRHTLTHDILTGDMVTDDVVKENGETA